MKTILISSVIFSFSIFFFVAAMKEASPPFYLKSDVDIRIEMEKTSIRIGEKVKVRVFLVNHSQNEVMINDKYGPKIGNFSVQFSEMNGNFCYRWAPIRTGWEDLTTHDCGTVVLPAGQEKKIAELYLAFPRAEDMQSGICADIEKAIQESRSKMIDCELSVLVSAPHFDSKNNAKLGATELFMMVTGKNEKP